MLYLNKLKKESALMTNKIPTKEIIFASIIMVLLAFLDLAVIPASLFGEIKILDVEPIYFSLIINQWLLIILGLVAVKYLCPHLVLGLKKAGFKESFKKYWPQALIILVFITFAYYIGLLGKYDYTPTVLKVVIETFVYNFSVGFLEELYIRGLLLAIIIYLLRNKENKVFIGIMISSLLFSLGHLPGMINAGTLPIIMRLIWTFMLGVYLGIVYKKTNNLWIPILIHIVINFSGISFNFTTSREFPEISVIIIMIGTIFIALGSIWDYFKSDKPQELTGFISQ